MKKKDSYDVLALVDNEGKFILTKSAMGIDIPFLLFDLPGITDSFTEAFSIKDEFRDKAKLVPFVLIKRNKESFEQMQFNELKQLRQSLLNCMDLYEQSDDENIFIEMYEKVNKFIKDKDFEKEK